MPAYPGSKPRPSSPTGRASLDRLVDWEANAYAVRRRHRSIAAGTPVDDELPDGPLADLDETRAALRRLSWTVGER